MDGGGDEMENQVGYSQPTNESSLGSGDVFTPMVEESKKPRLGMTFQSLVEAEEFYKEYGRVGGFDIRSSSTKYSQGILKLKLYVCSKEGISKRKSNEIRNCGTMRTGCKALIQLKTVNGIWMIAKFCEEHNHGVTSPRRRHFMRENRVVCDSKKKMVRNFKAANISTNKFMALLEKEGGGYDRIGCTEVDIRNYERDLREERRGHDAEMLLDFFMWQKEKNHLFHYEYEVDDEGRLTHCFWVDAIARLNYNIFGDVVTFDTTQNTNQYGLVFAPFIGVNNHWQTIFFGCGFLPNESANSFMWLFEKWLNVMGHPPKAMITDQHLGINTARSQIFPNTHHRYCIWHILDKLPDKLGAWAFNKEFKDPFIDNIWNASDSTEFEDKWKKILTNSCLMNHQWLSDMYAIRQQWVPIYLKHIFWAGMSSSQRSEGMNSFIKINASKKNSLHEFATIFERALARQREGELKADHDSMERKPKLKTFWRMEKQMSDIYTREIFYLFQEELQASLMYNVLAIKDDASETLYQITECGQIEGKRLVIYYKLKNKASCSCLLLEFKGIPCKHLLAFLKNTNHNELPTSYILRRWSQNIKKGMACEKVIRKDGVNNFTCDYIELNHLANKLVDEGVYSNETFKLARQRLTEAIEEIKLLKPESNEENDKHERDNEKSDVFPNVGMLDPQQVSGKGRRSGKRMKPGREIRRTQSRKCNSCGKRGQNHDSRNCPSKKASVSDLQQLEGMLNKGSPGVFDDDAYDDIGSAQFMDTDD